MIIRKLPIEVINKIAAGEVIQRPYNVVKELVENAIDAEATQIRINIRDGGIKLIEITDNGKGITKCDFPLLCQRFATSKISDIVDLQTISSFGFRGQALASLSYVSDLQITSKHRDQNIGYKCSYKDEKMSEQPEPLSMNVGTKIKASQLFGNLQTRRSSLNAAEEKKRIVRLISHFSIHYHYIKFTLETQKGSQLSTDFRNYKVSQSKMKVFQIITKLPYDKFSYLPKQVIQDIKIQAIITKLNTIKAKTLLLNVNNRIVENPEIFKAIQKAYSQSYQSIHEESESFFVYLSIDLDSKKIDCNIHPSKKTIGFFGADKIYENIYTWIIQHIKQESSIKNIATNITTKGKLSFNINKNMLLNIKSQSYQQNQSQNMQNQEINADQSLLSYPNKEENGQKVQPSQPKQYQHNTIRTDSLQMPINFYMKSKIEISQNTKYLKYNIKAQDTPPRQQNIKRFFQKLTYVGCFNLNYIFVHIESSLFLMNILPFLQSFIRQWLTNAGNKLIICDILDDYAKLNLRTIIANFLKRKRLEHKVNLSSVIDSILINKDIIYKQYGIQILENAEENNGIILSFPILEKFMSDCLIEDELAYFLCRLFAKVPNQIQRQKYFIDYLCSLFQEKESDEPKGEIKIQQQISRGQLSPMNDKYSQFMRDKVIPLLKTKGKDYKQLAYQNYLTSMLNIGDIYKVFERC